MSSAPFPPSEATPPQRFDWSSLPAKLGPVAGLLFVVALFAVLRPRTFLTTDNFQIMLQQTIAHALGLTQAQISAQTQTVANTEIAASAAPAAVLTGASPRSSHEMLI